MELLLFLNQLGEGYTSNISALGPTNEQLHRPDDAWLLWVKKYMDTPKREEGKEPRLLSDVSSMMAWLPVFLSSAS